MKIVGETKCAECGEETNDENVFVHEGKPYCSTCTAKHLKDEHHEEIMKRMASAATLTEAEKGKNSPEGKRAYTYKGY